MAILQQKATADWDGSFDPALTQIKATGRRFGSNRPMTESRLAPEAPRLEVSPLSKAEAPAAFALARLWRPSLEPAQWDAFLSAWRAAPESRGILSARNQRGGVLGFVSWWRQPDLEYGETLWAGPFVVREMGVRPLVRQSLAVELTALAAQLGARLRYAEEAQAPDCAVERTARTG
ncbi:hypothetical protein DA69_07695 [Brevundimonas naejangsanensis]|uniref:GNAT family N-acetyltransferase n=1 Tax=Brevundimonas naejangsanensis TaxID=588932 RepID=A0A172Y9L1_9CAUL|nr:hypothetical protein [Brevundimonas naejangsanensis]ANF55923.1 hypothetical protein DA69_07695 [Brevundimonas naejangsanensis]